MRFWETAWTTTLTFVLLAVLVGQRLQGGGALVVRPDHEVGVTRDDGRGRARGRARRGRRGRRSCFGGGGRGGRGRRGGRRRRAGRSARTAAAARRDDDGHSHHQSDVEPFLRHLFSSCGPDPVRRDVRRLRPGPPCRRRHADGARSALLDRRPPPVVSANRAGGASDDQSHFEPCVLDPDVRAAGHHAAAGGPRSCPSRGPADGWW